MKQIQKLQLPISINTLFITYMFWKSQLPLIITTAFLDILGMSLFIPLLPGIITAFWVQGSWAWFSQAVYAIWMFMGGFIFAPLSDKLGRKRMLSYTSILNLLGLIVMLISVWGLEANTSAHHAGGEVVAILPFSLSSLFSYITPMFVVFLLWRFIGGFGGAGYGVIGAYISDISTAQNRMRNMGLMGAAFGLAFLIWPAISGILSSFGISVHMILLITIALITLNVILIWTILEEPKEHTIKQENTTNIPFTLSSNLKTLLFLSLWASLAFAAIQSMSSIYYADKFHFTAAEIGYTMAMVWLVSVLYQWYFVKFVRKYFDEISMIHIAFGILTIAFIGFSLNTSPLWLFLWVGLFPLGMWSFNPSLSSLVSKYAWERVGKVMGYNTSVQSIGNIFGPIMAGLLYSVPGSSLPFMVSAGIFIILFIVSFLLRRNTTKTVS